MRKPPYNDEKFRYKNNAFRKSQLSEAMRGKAKHIHREAFCLMQYGCSTCGHQEMAWNSRDGVTPFGIGCPSCGQTLNHVNFGRDIYSPDHKPHSGQIVFRDGTIEESIAIIKSRMLHFDKTEYRISEARKRAWIKELQDGVNEEFKPGWPMVSRYAVLPSMLGDLTIDFVGPENSNILAVIDFLGDQYMECPFCKDPTENEEDCAECNSIALFFKDPSGIGWTKVIHGDTIEKRIDGYCLRK